MTDEPTATPEQLAARAVAGDRAALESLLRTIQDDVYNLAVRMLWHPDDAADATQDILLKLVTHLATFRGESRVRTWVYRIAVNHLLNVRKSRVEREELTFAAFGEQLARGLAEPAASRATEPEQALLEEEVKIGCTQGMLLALDREHRVAYILGDIFDLTGAEAAGVLQITPAAFRQRLARARERLRAFMLQHCGLVNTAAACRCSRRVAHAVSTGRVDPSKPLFAGKGVERKARVQGISAHVHAIEELHRIAAIYRSHPEYTAPEHRLAAIRRILDGDFPVLR